jgi:hypothetical protein
VKVELLVLMSLISILFSVQSASAQSTTRQSSLPSQDEIQELTSKAEEKVHDFMKVLSAAAPFLDKDKVAEYSKSAETAETIIQAMRKNGPTAYGLVALVTTLDDVDLDATRAALLILSRVAAGQITGESNQQKATSSVMALSDLDGSISDISELIVHATLRFVSAEENAIQAMSKQSK